MKYSVDWTKKRQLITEYAKSYRQTHRNIRVKLPLKYYYLTSQSLGQKRKKVIRDLKKKEDEYWIYEMGKTRLNFEMRRLEAELSELEVLQGRLKARKCGCYKKINGREAECRYFNYRTGRKWLWRNCQGCRIKKAAVRVLAKKLKIKVRRKPNE